MIADRVRGVRPDPAVVRLRWRWGAVAVAVALLLYLAYWRLSWSVPANSDSAATTLQAWDMLHGNWPLHGWTLSDVSFYTTEIPQYLLLELVLGAGAGVVHVAAAMSVTLIVVLAALLAAGPAWAASARERLARALLAAVIVMSPQASAALILLLGPDHTGTMVPVLATWLLVDRARAWRWLPLALGVALTWIMVGDSVVLLAVIVPLVATALARALRRGERAARRQELSLAAAAVVAAALGMLIPPLIRSLGGFGTWGLNTRLMPLAALPHDAWNVTQAVLTLLGADVVSPLSPAEAVFTWLHLAGLILAVAGLIVTAARFFREDSLVGPALAVAIVLEIGAYLASVHSSGLGSIREIVAVLPFGAVLAGRTLAAPALSLAGSLRGRSALTVAAVAAAVIVLGGYLGGLSYDATRPAVPSANQDVADWLRAHHLSAGLASYWLADSITMDTVGAVHIGAVVVGRDGKLSPYYWEASRADFSPEDHDARFVIADGPLSVAGLDKAAIRTLGPPRRAYHVGATTILVWDRNILGELSTR